MISRAGLELTNFLSPDLTWKTVSKGNRSAKRRTRKPVTRNLMVGMEIADDSQKRAEDTTVSESEKPGQRINGKIELVPIKKRRFNYRSPSSPPRKPSHNEVVRHASGPLLLAVDASNGKLYCREDFSGIEMLADAACSNSFDADVDHPDQKPGEEESLQEENNSAMPKDETVASLEPGNISPRDTVIEDRTDCSSFQDTTTAFAQNQKDNKIVEMSVPRLHWDLNVVMDAWGSAFGPTIAGSQMEDVEGRLHVLEDCETQKETEDVKHNDMVDIVASSEVHEKTHISSEDLRGLSNGLDRENNQLEASSHPDLYCDECCADSKATSPVVSLNPCKDSVACPNNVSSSTSHPSCLEERTECCASGVQEDEIVCAESAKVEKYDVAFTCVPALDRISCEVDRNTENEDGEDCATASSLCSDINAHQEMISVENCEPTEPVSHGVEPANISEEVVVNHGSSNCEDVAVPSESIKEVHSVVSGDGAKGETDSALHIQTDEPMPILSDIVTAKTDTECEVSACDECGTTAPTNSSCKIDIEEPCYDMSASDTSQDDKLPTVCMENSRDFQDGYDSQFEDGELRDLNEHCWEDNNCEGAEIDEVDYESECDGERLCILEADNKRKLESGSSQGSGDVTKKSELCAVGVAFGDSLASSEVQTFKAADGSKITKHIADCEHVIEKSEQCLGDAVGDSLASSEVRTSEAADGSKIKNHTTDCEHVPNGKDFTSRVVVVGSRALLSSDVLPRTRSGNFDDLCPRSEKEADPNRFMGRDRFAVHMRRRSPGGDNIVDTRQSPPCHGPYDSGRPRPRSILDSRGRRKYMSSPSNAYRPSAHIFSTHQLPPYHGLYGSGRPRPRSVIESCEFVMASDRSGVEGFDSRVQRPMKSSSNNDCQPIIRRSLANRDDIYAGTAAVRDDISPDRSRFRRQPLRDDSRGSIREHRFAVRMHRRSPGGGHIVDTGQSPPCHGPYDSGRPRPRSTVDSQGRRKYTSSPSNVYRPGAHTFSTHQSPPYHGLYGSGRPRPRSVIESCEFVMASDRSMLDATGIEGFDSRVRRPMNSSLNNVYQPINRGSLAYRDDIYAGTAAIRDDITPDRSRFRRRPVRDDSRGGIREEYCRPIPNYSTDDHMPHHLGRRERSISPLGGERLHCAQPYKKPRFHWRERSISPLGRERLDCAKPFKKTLSRSRSRSPNGWFVLRE